MVSLYKSIKLGAPFDVVVSLRVCLLLMQMDIADIGMLIAESGMKYRAMDYMSLCYNRCGGDHDALFVGLSTCSLSPSLCPFVECGR